MTFAIISLLSAVAAYGISELLFRTMLPRLGRRELGLRGKPLPGTDTAKDDANRYVPRTGGILAAAGILVSAVLFAAIYSLIMQLGSHTGLPRLSSLQRTYVWGGLVLAVLCSAQGLLDDWFTVYKNQPRGLARWQRLLLRTATAIAFLATVWLGGDNGAGITNIPFVGEVRLGIWYYVLSLPLIVGITEGTHSAGEAEGAVPLLTILAGLPFVLAAGLFSFHDTGIMSMALMGGLASLIMWNFAPAKTGCGKGAAAFSGGMLCAIAFGTRVPLLLFAAGGIFIAEWLVGWFVDTAAWISARRGASGEKEKKPETAVLRLTEGSLHERLGIKGKTDSDIITVFTMVTVVLVLATIALVLFGA